LAAQGYDVVALDIAAPDEVLDNFWRPVSERIRFVKGDVTDSRGIETTLRREKIDSIVHAAAITSPPGDQPDRLLRLLRVNLQGSVTVLDAAWATPSVKRFIYVSSGAVYGPTHEGSSISEESPIAPDSPYGLTKCASEAAVRYAHEEGVFTTVILRLGWIYGPMERPTSARSRMSEVWHLCHCALRDGDIRINDVTAVRDWTFSGDVGQAVGALLASNSLAHRVYNLGGGDGFSTESILAILRQRFTELRISVVAAEQANVLVNTQNRRGYLDIRRLQKGVGFYPEHDIASGMDAYIAWLQETGEV